MGFGRGFEGPTTYSAGADIFCLRSVNQPSRFSAALAAPIRAWKYPRRQGSLFAETSNPVWPTPSTRNPPSPCSMRPLPSPSRFSRRSSSSRRYPATIGQFVISLPICSGFCSACADRRHQRLFQDHSGGVGHECSMSSW